MRTAGYRDDALPPLSLACVIEHRHTPGRLDDLEIEAGIAAEVGQHRSHAALAEAAILRIVGSIDGAAAGATAAGRAHRYVERRDFASSWRRRAVLSAFTTRQFVLTQIGGLNQSKLILAHRRSFLLRLRRERRNSAVRRIDDERRPAAHAFMCGEHRRVVRAADILLRPADATVIGGFPTDGVSAQLVEFSALLVGEELAVGVLGWALQRDLAVARPDTLQIRLAPGGAAGIRGAAGA